MSKIKFSKTILMLFAICLLGLFLRLYKVNKFPVQLNHDEVTQLYDAISVARTGNDIYGNHLPFIFKSINDFKPPFYTYSTVLFYFLFGWQDITIKLTGVLFGVLAIPVIYLFTKELLGSSRTALVASFLTAIAPFELFFSRKGFENGAGAVLMLVGFTLLLSHLKNKRPFSQYSGFIVLALAMYTYFSHAILIPILVTGFMLIFRKRLGRFNIKPLVIALLVVAPLYYMIYSNADSRNRTSAVFIKQDPVYGQQVSMGGEGGRALSFIYKNKILADMVTTRYLNNFDPTYLFLNGMDFTNQGPIGVGPLLLIQFPFVLLGILKLIRLKDFKEERLFVLFWILVGFIPSGTTFEEHSPHRSIMVFAMLNIVSAVGVVYFAELLKKVNHKVAFLAAGSMIFLASLNFVYFVHMYFVNFPYEKSEYIHYPFVEVANEAWKYRDQVDQIIFDPKFGSVSPMIGTAAHYYMAYYGEYPPEKMQQEYRLGDTTKREVLFDKFSIRAVNWNEEKNLKNVLIIASGWSLPIGDIPKENIVKVINFYNNKPAFYVIKL
jgi:4-amino-4-deoxy-L-arabinose transferase-like glycosyltransferase